MQFVVVLFVLIGIVVVVLVSIFFYFLGVWVRALMSGARVPITALIGMKLRRVPPALIVDARIRLIKAGLNLSTDQLEAHYLAGGNVIRAGRHLRDPGKKLADLGADAAIIEHAQDILEGTG